MSILTRHISEGKRALPNGFYRARPQVLRVVLQTLERALTSTVAVIGDAEVYEPRFTRQLLVDFEHARDDTPGSPLYDITHQPELPIANERGVVSSHRRLDLRLVFLRQVGRTGDYLCLECKYLDSADRDTDREYVNEGVERIVIGDYARHHPWAVMVGLEKRGPVEVSVKNVNERLIAKYGESAAIKPFSSIGLPNVHESEHFQAGGPHRITIVHAMYLIVPVSC